MKYNIVLIGYGNWGKIVRKEIEKNKNLNLISIVSSHKIKEKLNVNIYYDFKSLLKKEIFDCIYVAKDPDINFEILNYCKSLKLPIIFEKPISSNYIIGIKMLNIIKKNKIIAFTNLPNIYAETYELTKKFFSNNQSKIKKVIFHEGDYGPIRNTINPILDWGIHPLTYLLSIMGLDKSENIIFKKKLIKNDGIRIISKMELILKDNFKIKIITGNLFKKKTRLLKIVLENGDIFINNFINHTISYNNKLIYKSKSQPLEILLNTFVNCINNNEIKEGIKNINISINAINLIEKK